jgi:immunity protein, SdpI family
MAIEHRARVAVFVAFVASIVAYGSLPAEIPPLWPVGDGYIFIGAPLVAFLLPVTAAVLWWLLARLSRASSSGPVPPVGAVTALFLSVFHVAMLLALVALLAGPQIIRLSLWPIRILGLTVGLFVAATGNQLPRLRRNVVWGIRTPQTLANEAVWRKVHRLAGYLQVATGFSIAMASLLDVRTLPQIIVVAVLVEILVCVAAGLIFSRQCSRAAAHGSL